MPVETLAPLKRETFADRSWDILLAVVSSILLLLITLAAHNLIPGWDRTADVQRSRYVGLSALRIISMNAVALDVAGSRVRAIGPDPSIVVEAPATSFRVASVEMSIRPALTITGHDFAISFIPAKASADEYLGARSASVTIVEGLQPLAPGVLTAFDRQLWMVNWTLPERARAWRIEMPERADFRLDYLEVRGDPGFQAAVMTAPWMMAVSAGAPIALLLGVWQWFGRPVMPSARTIKAILILALTVPLVLIAFLLPPFQGPDENAHWKLGLMFHRSGIAHEPEAYYLPETLETSQIAFRPDGKFKAQKLRLEHNPPGVDAQSMTASHQYLQVNYPYARVFSYPVMFVMSLLFPTVNTVPRALHLFYLCRLAPAMLIVALLFALNRRYELPYTAWFFFSLPLVEQQFVVISADTLLNIGSVTAVFWFLKLRQSYTWPLMIALCGLCLWITASKFIAGGVLLLPLLLVPYRRLPRSKRLIILAVILILPVLYFLGGAVLAAVRDLGRTLNRTAEVEGQLAFMRTGAGIKTFLLATARYAAGAAAFRSWSGPLGWVDTRITLEHLSLIAASGSLALFLDVWAYGPQLVRLVRTRAGEMAVLAGVAVGGLCFATITDAAIFYVVTTPVGGDAVASMMMKHLFPAAIVALLLPLALLRPAGQDLEPSRTRPLMIANTVALVLLPMLFLARDIELAFDLFTRYWG